MTEESARIMRAAAENSGRMSVLVPLCVAQFTATEGAMARFKTSSVYVRENLVSEVVKNVASTNMDYALAKAARAALIWSSQRRRRRANRPVGLRGGLRDHGGLTDSIADEASRDQSEPFGGLGQTTSRPASEIHHLQSMGSTGVTSACNFNMRP